jgi:A/G-specific adenine glycosylase
VAPPTDTLAAALLAWYDRAARDLPWRGITDPYAIVVSEVMLQQTQVETVKRYYGRFLQRLPDFAALAAAPPDEVMALWQGLGYYRRARGLQALAQAVMTQHGGRLPEDPAALRRLPGLGDYTAGAVASIAFGRRVPAVDGNVERVLTRLYAIDGDPRRGAARAEVRRKAAELVPASRPGDFNQALMELGARLCRPAPDCPACPWQTECRALASGDPTHWPQRAAAAKPRQRLHVAAVARRGGRLLLAQRPPEGRWGGLWELPRVELEPTADPVAGLAAGVGRALGVTVEVGQRLAERRHAVSGESIRLLAYAVELRGEPRAVGYVALRWVGADLEGLALPEAQRRILDEMEDLTGFIGEPPSSNA